MLAFVDSGSDCNYITREAALQAGLQPSWKKKPYSLHIANRQTMPRGFIINQEIHTTLHIQEHQQRVYLDIFNLANHNVILGLPWLQEFNPHIDWINQTLSLKNYNSTSSSRPTHQQRSIVDKKTNQQIASKPTHSEKAVTSTYRRKSLPNVRVLEKRTTPNIPQEYKEFRKLFKEELGKEALPKHQE
jgi:hypothetical protein